MRIEQPEPAVPECVESAGTIGASLEALRRRVLLRAFFRAYWLLQIGLDILAVICALFDPEHFARLDRAPLLSALIVFPALIAVTRCAGVKAPSSTMARLIDDRGKLNERVSTAVEFSTISGSPMIGLLENDALQAVRHADIRRTLPVKFDSIAAGVVLVITVALCLWRAPEVVSSMLIGQSGSGSAAGGALESQRVTPLPGSKLPQPESRRTEPAPAQSSSAPSSTHTTSSPATGQAAPKSPTGAQSGSQAPNSPGTSTGASASAQSASGNRGSRGSEPSSRPTEGPRARQSGSRGSSQSASAAPSGAPQQRQASTAVGKHGGSAPSPTGSPRSGKASGTGHGAAAKANAVSSAEKSGNQSGSASSDKPQSGKTGAGGTPTSSGQATGGQPEPGGSRTRSAGSANPDNPGGTPGEASGERGGGGPAPRIRPRTLPAIPNRSKYAFRLPHASTQGREDTTPNSSGKQPAKLSATGPARSKVPYGDRAASVGDAVQVRQVEQDPRIPAGYRQLIKQYFGSGAAGAH